MCCSSPLCLVVLISKVGKHRCSPYERCFAGFRAKRVTEQRSFQDVWRMSCTERRVPVFSLQQGPSAPLSTLCGSQHRLPRGSSSRHQLLCVMEETRCSAPLVSGEHRQEGRWGAAYNLDVCSDKHVISKGIFKARRSSLNFQQVSADSTGLLSICETFPKFSLWCFSFHCGITRINKC